MTRHILRHRTFYDARRSKTQQTLFSYPQCWSFLPHSHSVTPQTLGRSYQQTWSFCARYSVMPQTVCRSYLQCWLFLPILQRYRLSGLSYPAVVISPHSVMTQPVSLSYYPQCWLFLPILSRYRLSIFLITPIRPSQLTGH